MKTNVPEKIYIDDPTGEFDDHWSVCQNNDSVEYTSTDAIIEKVEKFMKTVNRYLYHCVSEECDYVDTDKFIEGFRDYMKGE